MNISSAIVAIAAGQEGSVNSHIVQIGGCEIHLQEPNKSIITIEAENIDVETQVIKKVESIKGVLSVRMVYAYSEQELEAERDKIEISPDYPDWLNKEEVSAREIPYSGNLKGFKN